MKQRMTRTRAGMALSIALLALGATGGASSGASAADTTTPASTTDAASATDATGATNATDATSGARWSARVVQPQTVPSPPASEYESLPVCAAPAPGQASCLALTLAPRTAAARVRTHATGLARSAAVGAAASAEACARDYPSCLTPHELGEAYFPGEAPQAPASEPQTVALVDAYDDPNIEADLRTYDEAFGLPACTEANGCFAKLNQNGEAGHPPSARSTAEKQEAQSWALEISTDVETVHAVCQNCRVVLVEADDASYQSLATAEETAARLSGVDEISNSWGGPETELTQAQIAAFDHPGLVIAASAGDDGYLDWDRHEAEPLGGGEPDFPASSPDVVAVGGTHLSVNASTGAWAGETVWNDDREGASEGASGGGCSLLFPAQAWQRAVSDWSRVGCEAQRAVADVSADADPDSGVAVYDSVPYPYEEGSRSGAAPPRWVPIGGTSLASPIVAAMFALAGGAHGVQYPAQTLYSHLGSRLLHDVAPSDGVSAGGNGECDDDYATCSGSMNPLSPLDCGEGVLICNAAVGYDGPSGVGTPAGVGAFRVGGEGAGGGGESGDESSKAGTGGGSGATGSEGSGGSGGESSGGSGGSSGGSGEGSSGGSGGSGSGSGGSGGGSGGESNTGGSGNESSGNGGEGAIVQNVGADFGSPSSQPQAGASGGLAAAPRADAKSGSSAKTHRAPAKSAHGAHKRAAHHQHRCRRHAKRCVGRRRPRSSSRARSARG